MNKVILQGRLTRDPETKYSMGNDPITISKIGIAVNRRFKRPGEPDADFFNCVAFGKTAEFISKYFKKGQLILIFGELKTGSYINQTGQKINTTDVIIQEVEFCGDKKSDTNEDLPKDEDYSFYTESKIEDDDSLPF